MTGKERKRIKIGDVYAIPLPNGTCAFGRKYKDGSIAIYKHIGESYEDIPMAEEYQLLVYMNMF